MEVLSRWRTPDPRKVDFHCGVIFTCATRVNKVETMYGRSRLRVKIKPRYARLSYIASSLLLRKLYVRTHAY